MPGGANPKSRAPNPKSPSPCSRNSPAIPNDIATRHAPPIADTPGRTLNSMSPTMTGFVVGATLAVVAGVALSAFGGAGVALLVPFAAAILRAP